MSVNHILGYEAIKIIRGKKTSENFIKNLVSIHKIDTEEIKFIIDFKTNN